MSLETLRQNLVTEAAGGQINIHAATFAGAGLKPPADLDGLLSKAFVDLKPAEGLPVSTTPGDIGPIEQGGSFMVGGTVNVRIAEGKQVRVKFSASGDQGALVIGIELTDAWNFGQSYVSLSGRMFAGLGAAAPYFFFAGQPESAYPWSDTAVALVPGLNFAGHVSLDGYLSAALLLLPGLSPQPSYVLSGTVDSSTEVQELPDGKKIYGYPGLVLASTDLAEGEFQLGYLVIKNPYLSVTLVDLGEPVGLAPAVMLAATLEIPGGSRPEFRAQLPVSGKTQIVAFSIAAAEDELALTADQLFALMAGQTWYGIVPPSLSAFLQQFGFRSFGATISYGASLRVNNVQVVIASGSPWVVWEDPPLSLTFELDWTIRAPFQAGQSQYAVLVATAKFMPELFPGDFRFSIDTDLTVSGGYAAADPSEYVSFNALAEAVTGGLVKVPEQFVSIDFQEFFVTFNQPARSYSFGATTSIKLPIVGAGKFELNDVALRLNVQRPQVSGGQPTDAAAPAAGAGGQPQVDGAGTRYDGSVRGSLIIGPLYLLAEGSYVGGVWTFGLAMQPGTSLGLQQLINEIFEDVQLPTDIFDLDVTISDVALQAVVPAEKELATTYSASGSIRWQFAILGQQIDTLARVSLTYNSKALPSPFTGSVTATTTFDLFGLGATFDLGYDIRNEPGKQQATETIFLRWQGLTASYVQGSGQKTLEFTADNTWNLGRLISAFVRLVSPSSNRELPTPWNLLNNVSLAGLRISFNLATNAVSVSWPLRVKLFFGEIESVNLVKSPGQQVEVTLTGKFLFTNTNDVKWDPVTQDPPEVPGGGTSAFDLRLLALGQRVTVPDLAAVKTVNDAVNQLTGFKQLPPATRVVPVGPGIPPAGPSGPPAPAPAAAEPEPPVFSADSNWLIGTHFLAVSSMLDLKVIFNDPVLYGLRIGLAGPKAKIFAGLEFEIMYKKVTDSIGMYRVMLKLPDAMRYLQFGQVTVILPIVTVEIYTNGNFKIDFGFPYNMDFSVSFTVQVFPFTGSGGFYFGLLNGATSSQVPSPTPCGNFTPVVEFGLGLQVGLGKSLSIGVLRAEISVTVFGIIEGVVAAWRAYDQSDLMIEGPGGRPLLFGPETRALTTASGGSSDVETSYYYKVAGTIGVIGKIVGVVDFAIIKAEVSLSVYAYIKGTFEAYRKSVITVEAGVRVSLKFTINCGLFKITLNLSFSARVREVFTIGRDHPEDAPWYCGGQTGSLRLAARRPMSLAEAVRTYALAPDFGPLKTPPGGVRTLVVYFLPQLSVAGEGAAGKEAQEAVYSINLFVSNEPHTQGGETYRSFEELMRGTYLWVASSFSGSPDKGTPEEELLKSATLEQMQAALEYLSANSDGHALSYDAVAANLSALFLFEVRLPPAGPTMEDASDGAATTALPMPPGLTLRADYQGETVADVDFLTWATAGEAYLEDLRERINKLIAQMLDELEKENDGHAETYALLRQPAVADQSLATFVFVDYFAVAARYLVQAAIDTFKNYAYPLESGDSIASVREKFNAVGDGNLLTDDQIAWANREHPLTAGLELTVNGVPYRLQEKDLWGEIADSHGLAPGQLATDNALVEQVLIPGQQLDIAGVVRTVPNDGTLAATGLEFGLTPAQLGEAIAPLPGVLQPLTVITLNGLKHTTADDAPDTLTLLMQRYGIDIGTLTPSVAGEGGLFDREALATLLLPGLRVLTNAELWADIVAHEGVSHLSGMAARYLLSGLRLPVAGVTFADPSHPCAHEETCGLQNLTGQQFRLPSLKDYEPAEPMLITLANAGTPWVTFVDPADPEDPSQLAFEVPPEAAAQVNALVEVARDEGLRAPIKRPEALRLAAERPRQYTFAKNIILQTAAALPLPDDALPAGTTPRPNIWSFSAALLSELSRPVELAPRFLIEIGSTDTEGGRVIPSPALAYGFGTLINVAVKRVVADEAGKPVSPSTCELVGADEVGVNQLEQLLGVITPEDTSLIDGIYILYQPNQTSERAQGLQYDGEQNYATFLVRANLSSETNPPAGPAPFRLTAGEDGQPRGLLNSPYQFLSELWSGSIVRSGGYYFFYELADGSSLPPSLFNADLIANISVLIVYAPTGGVSGAAGGLLRGFMNVAVTNDPVDQSGDVVYLKSLPRAAEVTMSGDVSLEDIAAAYHSGVIEIAEANLDHPLSAGSLLTVTDIVHQVGRGETLAQIAAYFDTTEQAIKDENPHVDFADLRPGTGLHIPELTTSPQQGTPGLTLPDIARHYDTSAAALAWANRGVKGLYTPETPLAFEDLLLDKESTLPPGNVGLVVERENPGDDQTQPSVYLEQAYNMLGYDLITNTDCVAIADALPLPSTPAEEESEEEVARVRAAAPLTPAAGTPWVYTFTVPAARAARNNPVPESTSETPYPDRGMNPYAGVGGFVQLSLDWRDMMGNRAWSPFDDSSPGNTYPLNVPPSRVGFTDDVPGLGQWPSTQFDHYFEKGQTGPELRVEWSFDPSRYAQDQPPLSGDDMPLWERNAKADRQVFANVYYQLVQTDRGGGPAALMETVTSLAGHQPQAVSAKEADAVRAYVLAAWRYVVQVLENEGDPPPPSELPQPVRLTRAVDASAAGAITEVSVVFRLRRPHPTVLADFRDEAASTAAATVIGPRLVQQLGPDGENSGYTLDWYTQQFQAAFDGPEFGLRLATGVSRTDLGGGQRRDTLWAVRFGKSDAQPFYYTLDEPAMFFAPAPLSTTLVSRPNVSLYGFTASGGLSPTPDVTQSFTGVDLDVWGRAALASIDQLLAPQYAVPAFLVDDKGGTGYLQRVLDTKFKLAGAVVQGVTNILCKPKLDPDTDPDNFAAAREKLRQQLLITLENAYTVDAIIQYRMNVTAADPQPGELIAPRLYGNAVSPDQAVTAEDYAVGSFKAPLSGGGSLLTYTFRAREARRQSSFQLALEYRPTHIEHQITDVPGIEDYEASSWLNFLDSLPPVALAGGGSPPAAVEVNIPIPLRAYPTPPSLLNQGFLHDEGESPETTLEQAKEWTYRFVYSQAHASQDRIDSVLRLNVPLEAQARLMSEEQVDLVVMLARINHLLGQIQAVFERDLINVKLDTPTTSATFRQAQNALSAFATLTDGLDAAWGNWVKAAAADASARNFTSETEQQLPFSILEDPVNKEAPAAEPGDTLKVLRVTVVYPTGLLPGIGSPPAVTFEGYTPEEVSPEEVAAAGAGLRLRNSQAALARLMGQDDCEPTPDDLTSRKAWIYKKDDPQPGESPYLTWDQALDTPERRVELGELDAIRFQNAWANVRIIRNLDLVGEENPAREPFVYRTPAVQFRNTLTPLLSTSKEVNVAKVPTGTAEQRTLAGHLTALFKSFFAGSPSQAQLVKMETRYAYALSDAEGAPAVELPVLMIPPTGFEIPADWQSLVDAEGTGVSAEAFIKTLAERIQVWYDAHDPSTRGARYLFDLSAFSSLSNNTQPLVRVRNLLLNLSDIEEP